MLRRMRHLYWGFACVLVIVISLIAPMRLVAEISRPRVDYLFTNADGSACERPCMFGVRPRLMSFRLATQLLRQHPLVEQMDESGCSRMAGFCTFRVRLLGASGAVTAMEGSRGPDQSILVDDVYLSFDRPGEAPVLGDFISALGTDLVMIPHYDCCGQTALESAVDKLLRFGPTYALTLYYPRLGVELTDFVTSRHAQYALDPRGTIKGVRVFPPYPTCTRTKVYWDQWHGFVSLATLYEQRHITCG
jgi:hypothetical protein